MGLATGASESVPTPRAVPSVNEGYRCLAFRDRAWIRGIQRNAQTKNLARMAEKAPIPEVKAQKIGVGMFRHAADRLG